MGGLIDFSLVVVVMVVQATVLSAASVGGFYNASTNRRILHVTNHLCIYGSSSRGARQYSLLYVNSGETNCSKLFMPGICNKTHLSIEFIL